MKIKANVSMVLNLDKCIGCHTCSVTCKNTWTNRTGAEYIWYNNVETKPGVGYPVQWEDQDRWHGGWVLRHGRLELNSGHSRLARLARIFFNPDLPTLDDYYEPSTYDYQSLTNAPEGPVQPVARARSAVDGSVRDPKWGPNWEDDLAGGHITGPRDPGVVATNAKSAAQGLGDAIRFEYEQAFMMYLPRLCEHCLNPSCVASCPSGAMYKRDEDGIVLVDQEACRAWRFCVSNCPYKKVYFNWHTQKAEKCTFCYPRIEAGQPTICAETCVGRIRYIGMMLYDADRVHEAASITDPKKLLDAQLGIFLDAADPAVARQARADGIAENVIAAAARSPTYQLAARWKVALPLHPEFRTLPMVWYIPPLSPLANRFVEVERDGTDPLAVFPAVEEMRIPITYLANLLTAGDETAVRAVLYRLWAMRVWSRENRLGQETAKILAEAGMDDAEMAAMYRLLTIGKYEDRYVIPPSHQEMADSAFGAQGSQGLDFAGGPAAVSDCAVAEQEGGSRRQPLNFIPLDGL